MLSLVEERKQIARQFPNLVDYESKRAFMHVYDTGPMPTEGATVDDVEVRRGLLGTRRVTVKRPFRRSSKEAWEGRRRVRIVRTDGRLIW